MNKDLVRRINAFEQRCYKRPLKIKWTDKIFNEEVLKRTKEDELCLYIQKQKMAFTGHVLRGSTGEDALQILEGKLEATTAAQGRPRRIWLDDIKQWTQLTLFKDWLKIDLNGELAPRHVNLLIQKTTADDDDDCMFIHVLFYFIVLCVFM